MKKTTIILTVMLLIAFEGFSQTDTVTPSKLKVNYILMSYNSPKMELFVKRLDSLLFDYKYNDIKLPEGFIEGQFIAGTSGRWNYPNYEILNLLSSDGYVTSSTFKPVLINFHEVSPSIYKGKVAFYAVDRFNDLHLKCFFYFYAKYENEDFKFIPSMDFNTQTWKQKKIGNITFNFKPNHHFNSTLAEKTDSFNTAIAHFFDEAPRALEHFVFENTNEMYTAMGYENEIFQISPNQIGGLCNLANEKVYAGNNSEWYPHELVHIYVYRRFFLKKNYINSFFDEGLATWFGGCVNKSIKEHIPLVEEYLKKENLDLNNLDMMKIDEFGKTSLTTNFQYVAAALLCKYATKRYGKKALWNMLNNSYQQENMVSNICKTFKVKPNEIGKLIQSLIIEEAKSEDDFLNKN